MNELCLQLEDKRRQCTCEPRAAGSHGLLVLLPLSGW